MNLRLAIPGWLALGGICLVAAGGASAGVIYTPDMPYPASAEIFTVDPQPMTNANRGLTTTRELYQTFQNPADLDVRRMVMSFRVTNATTGLQLKLYEVEDTTTSPLALGSLIHTIQLPAGSYTTSSNRLGVTLTDSDVFTLPQRNAGSQGYALSISQIDTSGSVVSGNLIYANNGVDNYPNGKVFQETLVHSSATRDAGIALSSVPEPASAALLGLLMAIAALCRGDRRRAA
jgi:hypothetical protein